MAVTYKEKLNGMGQVKRLVILSQKRLKDAAMEATTL